MEQNREEPTQTETQEEEQEGALDSLLRKVDLGGPLEIKDHAGNIVEVPKDKFIKYYMPQNTPQEQVFHCMQAVRATGLSLFAPGECYFFKTGDGPVKLFTGYMAYLRKAYAAGLEHIEKPEIDFGADPSGYPLSCTITIKIKGRDDMEWTTWFSEVAGATGDGLNKRWKKAPIQMLIKCAIVNILRLSGLVDFTMPYTIDEMPDPVVEGFRTLTQAQLETHNLDAGSYDVDNDPEVTLEATPGEVSATDHQIDMAPLHKIYRGKIAERELFPDDTTRKMWQSEIIGKASTADWDALDFNNATGEIESERCEQWVKDNQPKPDPDPPASGGDPARDSMPDVPEEHQEQPTSPLTNTTKEAIKAALVDFGDRRYQTVKSVSFKIRAAQAIERDVDRIGIAELTEAEGMIVLESLIAERKAALEKSEPTKDGNLTPEEQKEFAKGAVITSETVAGEITDDDPLGQGEPVEPSGWFESVQRQEQIDAYMVRIHRRWDSVESMAAFHEETTGIRSFSEWEQEHFDHANAALDELDLADKVKKVKPAPATPEEPATETCTDEDFKELGELFGTLLPDKQYAMGSKEAHALIHESKAVKGVFTRIKILSTEEVSDLKHFLNDKITHMKADAEARAESHTPHFLLDSERQVLEKRR